MARKKKTKKGKLSNTVITIILVIVLLIGLSVLLYPTVSNWWNSRVQSRSVALYKETVSEMSDEEYASVLAAANDYNARLTSLGSAVALAYPSRVGGYDKVLDVDGTGMMGYVTIEKINIELPIYHGTGSVVLSKGAGHLEGTSLPVGGESTHSVISAHRGLPSAKLFTNLNKLEEGDIFSITVLNETLYYEVDKISIVLPNEVRDIYIEDGKDYCTLMTCTPYGINTHRLLVRGVRTDDPNAQNMIVDANASKINSLLVALFIAIPLLIILFIYVFISTRRKKKKGKKNNTPPAAESPGSNTHDAPGTSGDAPPENPGTGESPGNE